MRVHWLILLSVFFLASPSAGQVPTTASRPEPRDSLVRAAERAGWEAASSPGVEGIFTISFVGGAVTGFLGPISLFASSPGLFVGSGLGVVLLGGSFHAAWNNNSEPPPEVTRRPRDLSPIARQEFVSGYSSHFRRRRFRASVLGAGVGIGVGFGLLLFLASQSEF